MVLRIRLSRFGQKHSPIYNIVLAQAKSARDSKPLEVLGTYDPSPKQPLASRDTPEYLTDPETGDYLRDEQGDAVRYESIVKKYKDVRLDKSRVKYWLGVGAKPTEGVERILGMIGLMEPRPGRTAVGASASTTGLAENKEAAV